MQDRTNQWLRPTAVRLGVLSCALVGFAALWFSMQGNSPDPPLRGTGNEASDDTYAPPNLQGRQSTETAEPPHPIPQGSGRERGTSQTSGRWLDVRVVDAAGAPVPTARVTVQMQAIRIPVDANGHARLGPLGPQHAYAWANASGYVQKGFTVPHEEDDSGPLTREVVLQRAHDISGRVVWRDGRPAARIDVQAPGYGQTKTDGEGRFSISGFPPGKHEIRAGHDRGWRWGGVTGVQILVAAGEVDAEIRLHEPPPPEQPLVPDPEPLRVHVTDAGGNPVARCELLYAGGEERGSVAVVSGVASVPTRDVEVVFVHGARDESGALLPLAPALWRRDGRGTGSILEIGLPPGRTISGTVRDLEGRAVSEVTVRAQTSKFGACGPSFPLGESSTDASGAFRIARLPESPCEIVVVGASGYRQVDTLQAAAPQTGLVLVLERLPETRCEITVLDEKGSPVQAAQVRIRASGWDMMDGRTDAHGRVILTLWEPDRATELAVFPPASDEGRSLAPMRVAPWQVGDQVVRLGRGRPVAGTVCDPAGSPVPYARVERMEDDGRWRYATLSHRDGTFSLGLFPLEPGSLLLRACVGKAWPSLTESAGDWQIVGRHDGAPAEVEVGTESATLVVDPGVPLRIEFEGWPSQSPTLSAVLAEEEAPESGSALAEYDIVPTWSAPVDARGRATFIHLYHDKTYVLWVGPVGEGRYALVHGIRGSETRQRIPLERGLRTVVRVGGRTPPSSLHVTAKIGTIEIGAERIADDRFVFSGLPPGTWPIRATSGLFGGDSRISGAASVQAGQSVTIEVEEGGTTGGVPPQGGSK